MISRSRELRVLKRSLSTSRVSSFSLRARSRARPASDGIEQILFRNGLARNSMAPPSRPGRHGISACAVMKMIGNCLFAAAGRAEAQATSLAFVEH